MQTAAKHKTDETSSDLITTTQACEYFGRSRAWLDRKWRDPDDPSYDENFPKPYKLSNRANSFSLKALDVWTDSVRVTSGESA